jgi:hypothetical protein
MKFLAVLGLVLISFFAGVLFQRYRNQKRILELSSYWHLSGPNLPSIAPTALDPSGIAIWQCPALVKGENTIFYAPLGYTEGLSGCSLTGKAKIVLELQ